MKFTLSWLKDHLDTDKTLDAIVAKLTMIGLEVEHVEDRAKALAPFTIARVISAERHPNADRLSVCLVDTGSGDPVQVVCGAPNARTGMKGVFSPPGTYIPGKNMTLGIGTIRGVESRGMLLSEFELQLSDDHEGIIDLPADAPVGTRYAEWAQLDDPTIEINLTPNRPDCTGVHGIARVMAIDYALEGIRVNVVVPGFTLSPIVHELVADPAVLEWNLRNIPMRRGAQPDEIAGAVAFLASDDASYMTGSFVIVDGGLTAA